MDETPADDKPVAVITGAAGGIGGAIASMLQNKGYRLALLDINQKALDNLMNGLGSGHLGFTSDITDRAKVLDTVADIISKFGRIDVLVNNAGMVLTKPFVECSLDSLITENELNYLAALVCTKAVLPCMQSAKTGTIVSIASLGGIIPLSVSPGYTASKAALRGLMLSLNMALKPHGIHVGCVNPSAVDTQMLYHEATHGGSNLNFLQTPLSTTDVAKGVWQVIHKKKMEVCIPWHEGLSSKFAGAFPSILPRLMPVLEYMGDRNRIKYLNKKHNS